MQRNKVIWGFQKTSTVWRPKGYIEEILCIHRSFTLSFAKQNDLFFLQEKEGFQKLNAVYWWRSPLQKNKEPSLSSVLRIAKHPQSGHFIKTHLWWKCWQCKGTILLFQEPFWNASDWSRILTILSNLEQEKPSSAGHVEGNRKRTVA